MSYLRIRVDLLVNSTIGMAVDTIIKAVVDRIRKQSAQTSGNRRIITNAQQE